MVRALARGLLLAVASAALVRPAHAQAAQDGHGYDVASRVSVGGEVAVNIAPADTTGYFNHTDYNHDALRRVRLSLQAEFRASPTLALVGEVRSDNGVDVTAPAFYLRWRPAGTRGLSILWGRVPPVIGAYPRRAYSVDNAVIGEPLAYQYLTSLRPDSLPATPDDLLRMRSHGWAPRFPIGAATHATGLPLVSASKWDTGVEATWHRGWIDAAMAVSEGSPAAPVVSDTNSGQMISGRVATRFPVGLTVGISAARGQWLSDSVLALTPGGRRTPSAQSVVGTDAEYGLGPWLVRGEWLRSVFDIPIVGSETPNMDLAAWSGFIETRYRFLPRWSIGLRTERLSFSRIQASSGAMIPWDAPVSRIEGALGFRATRHFELRAGWQEDWRCGGHVRKQGFPAIGGALWF
jgi:hypothetical protein